MFTGHAHTLKTFLAVYQRFNDFNKIILLILVDFNQKVLPLLHQRRTTRQKLKTTSEMTTTQILDWQKQSYTITVEKNKSLEIACTYTNVHDPKPTVNKFRIGDEAEYDSYNLRYTGKIIAITENTVSIDTGNHTYNKKGERVPLIKRMKMGDFCWKNWNFDAAECLAYNQLESQFI